MQSEDTVKVGDRFQFISYGVEWTVTRVIAGGAGIVELHSGAVDTVTTARDLLAHPEWRVS